MDTSNFKEVFTSDEVKKLKAENEMLYYEAQRLDSLATDFAKRIEYWIGRCDSWQNDCEQLRQRVQELEERRCEVCGYAEHHREHTGCLRVKVKELTTERDKATQYWQIAEGRCNALKQQRDELVAAQQWQPIETAPKDTFVLLAGPSGYTTIETVFATGRMCSDYHKGRWIDHANDDLTDWGFVPTHWMPLPYVPAIASVKEKS